MSGAEHFCFTPKNGDRLLDFDNLNLLCRNTLQQFWSEAKCLLKCRVLFVCAFDFAPFLVQFFVSTARSRFMWRSEICKAGERQVTTSQASQAVGSQGSQGGLVTCSSSWRSNSFRSYFRWGKFSWEKLESRIPNQRALFASYQMHWRRMRR